MRSAAIMVAILLSACAADRYRWNLAHQHLMPNASKLPRADIEEITRLVSERSPQPILGISRRRGGPHAGEVTVVTAYRVETTQKIMVLTGFGRKQDIGASLREVLACPNPSSV